MDDTPNPSLQNKNDDALKEIIATEVANQLKGQLFTARKLTDMPTDDLQVVPRKYVTLNGKIASRPASVAAVMGQFYYATDINIPLTYDSTNVVWRNGVGSVIASN